MTPENRLRQIAQCLAVAAKGEMVLGNTLLALDRALPLFTSPHTDWRDANRALISGIAIGAYRAALVLVRACGDRVSRKEVFLGFSAFTHVLGDPETPYASDRATYARILLCRLSILLDETALADRGHLLTAEIDAQISAQTVSPLSIALH